METNQRQLLGVLRRLTGFAAAVLLAWPAAPATPTGPTSPTCPGGSEVNIDDFIVWVDIPGGGSAEVPVWAASACGVARTITYKTYDITARAGEDYVGVNTATITLPAGTKNAKIRIQILNKSAQAPDETFGIRLLSGATFDDPDAVVTIKTR